MAGVSAWIARTGYTGEDGFELFCARRTRRRCGTRCSRRRRGGGKPVGLGARDTLRLEARLPLYGNDIDETTTPLEAGLGWVVKLDGDDFIGRDALRAQKAAGVTRKLVGFEMTGRGIARHGYPILDDAGAACGPGHLGRPGADAGEEHRPGLRADRAGRAGHAAFDRLPRQARSAPRWSSGPFYKRGNEETS